jgi:hypothetical protein
MDMIPEATWNHLVLSSPNSAPHTLGKELGKQPTLMVFLRHLG